MDKEVKEDRGDGSVVELVLSWVSSPGQKMRRKKEEGRRGRRKKRRKRRKREKKRKIGGPAERKK